MLPAAASYAVSRIVSCAVSGPAAASAPIVAQTAVPKAIEPRPALPCAAVPSSIEAAAAAGIAPALTASDPPPEIWGLVADFSSRHTVFNLRAVSTSMMSAVHETLTSFTIEGGAQLRTFMRFRGFVGLKTLRVQECDDADLAQLVRFLTSEPHPSLALTLCSNVSAPNTAAGLERLRDAPLGKLQLWNWSTTRAVVNALARLSCPVELKFGHQFGPDVDLGRIPALTMLDRWRSVDDAALQALQAHPSLAALTFSFYGRSPSAAGIRLLAGIGTLRTVKLSMREMPDIGVGEARALAAGGLEKLTIQPHSRRLGEAVVAALARGTAWRHLSLPVHAGVRHFGELGSLETLELTRGSAEPGTPVLRLSTRDVLALGSLPALRSLSISQADFDAGAFSLLACHAPASLRLSGMVLGEGAIDALLANPVLTDLTMEDMSLSDEEAVRLARHPQFECLGIHNRAPRFSHLRRSRQWLAIAAAWVATGRPLDRLDGDDDADVPEPAAGGERVP
ncbi:MAG: hypothetical protein ACRYGL_15395 [Janthinobacterium lividum]